MAIVWLSVLLARLFEFQILFFTMISATRVLTLAKTGHRIARTILSDWLGAYSR